MLYEVITRDGMNLVAKEFVACQTNDIGVLVLSEMAGAAAELNECLLINPVDNNEIADSLNLALIVITSYSIHYTKLYDAFF